ncbi:MAG: di-trans,poly-cis-decaprenylcistransferase [Holosporales bacterium]|jgi:undecaprenyl diphosphate synthase|nr:di-trans,poly-cis-decaprenylcistransferase [Holosporales bacterium]
MIIKVPNHVSFIMDGNSSWAKTNNKPIMQGYLKGMRTMADTILWAKEFGIRYTTFYAFSFENWERPKAWVKDFMALAMQFFKNDDSINKILDAGAKLIVIGNISKLDPEFRDILVNYELKTKTSNEIVVCLAISYGGRDEIVRAAKKMAEIGLEFTEESFSANLDTAGIPDPDMMIRTSFKERISNFLLWQHSYTEFYFSKLYWPDFNKQELETAINCFSKRDRTYGK